MTPQEITAQETLAKVFNVQNSQITILERFKLGMSNFTYKAQVGSDLYVIRIPGFMASLFVDFKIELKVLTAIKETNITSDVVYYQPESGIKISKYLEGVSLANLSDISSYYPEIAAKLHELHALKLEIPTYNYFHRVKKYESYLPGMIDPRYFELKRRIIILSGLKYANFKEVPTHGDIQRSNIVLSQGQLFFLDWEFFGINDPFYDVASFGNISFDDSKELLKHYLGRVPTIEESKRLIYNRILQTLQWYLVAKKKQQLYPNNELGLDFGAISEHYLDLSAKLLEEYEAT
ncbi:MAG: phosphotransferase family protein [Erysipelotrichaceae bacterium]|jgi:thiamine kinase-like enzyme|nr:phosphotransferase family protein [Erysipelotrichaceae bacterium]